MEAKEFERQLLDALNKLTAKNITHIKNELEVNTDYTIDEDGFSSKEEIKMIKFTQDEYDEFEKLKRQYDMHVIDIWGCLNNIVQVTTTFSSLQEKLYDNNTVQEDVKAQTQFIKALTGEEPYTKIVPDTKYYLHVFPDREYGYLNYRIDNGYITLQDKRETDGFKTKFTEQDILNLQENENHPGLNILKIKREKAEDE